LLAQRFAIHRLAPDRAIDWTLCLSAPWFSITRTEDELSIVAPEALDLGTSVREPGWSCLKIDQALDFSLVGILAGVSHVLADASVSIFAVSTYDTDYILVKIADTDRAVAALKAAGHAVDASPAPGRPNA
jgi:hypothetical protein